MRIMVAPRQTSRLALASTCCLRVWIGTVRPPLAWMSRCSRFLTALASGTTWNQMRGPWPCGSKILSAPIPHLPGVEVTWDFPGGGYCCPECGEPFTPLG